MSMKKSKICLVKALCLVRLFESTKLYILSPYTYIKPLCIYTRRHIRSHNRRPCRRRMHKIICGRWKRLYGAKTAQIVDHTSPGAQLTYSSEYFSATQNILLYYYYKNGAKSKVIHRNV